MKKLRFDCTGSESSFHGRVSVLVVAMLGLESMNGCPENIGKIVLKQLLDRYRGAYDAAKFFDRYWSGQRKLAKYDLIETVKRAFRFLEAVASEEDLIILQKAGATLQKAPGKKSSKTVSVTE